MFYGKVRRRSVVAFDNELRALKHRLIGEIDPRTDSLRFYYLGANRRRRVEHVGAKPALDLEGPLVV